MARQRSFRLAWREPDAWYLPFPFVMPAKAGTQSPAFALGSVVAGLPFWQHNWGASSGSRTIVDKELSDEHMDPDSLGPRHLGSAARRVAAMLSDESRVSEDGFAPGENWAR
jgi:hypothetical protein